MNVYWQNDFTRQALGIYLVDDDILSVVIAEVIASLVRRIIPSLVCWRVAPVWFD